MKLCTATELNTLIPRIRAIHKNLGEMGWSLGGVLIAISCLLKVSSKVIDSNVRQKF